MDLRDQEFDRLERVGVISKAQYSKWAADTLYVKKKNKPMCVCTDFMTDLNKCLKTYEYLLLRYFCKLWCDTNPSHPFITTDCLDRVSQYSMVHIWKWVKRSYKIPLPQTQSSVHKQDNIIVWKIETAD